MDVLITHETKHAHMLQVCAIIRNLIGDLALAQKRLRKATIGASGTQVEGECDDTGLKPVLCQNGRI